MKLKKLALLAAVGTLCSTSSLAQLAPKGTIYLTFDDGPVNASIDVINVLNEGGVKGTFFFNGWHLDGIADENEDRALEALRLALNTGHVIGNHSYNHMVHNCVEKFGPNSGAECNATGNHQINSYQDPVYDASIFAQNLTVLEKYIPTINSYPNYKGAELARLPYTNGWRVSKNFKADGLCSTSDDFKPWEQGFVCDPENPSNSVKSSIQLHNILANKGYQTYGWDLDWAPENWGISMPANSLTNAKKFLSYVDAAMNSCAPTTIEPVNSKAQNFPCETSLHTDKVVVLSHEFLFEDGKRGMGATKNLPKMAEFIRIAKEAGYVFDTLDNYIPTWTTGKTYQVGDYVLHAGVVYKAIMSHTAQGDWAPSSASTLWSNADPVTNWTLNVAYDQGDIVSYKGKQYRVNMPHTSQQSWEPDAQKSIFTEL